MYRRLLESDVRRPLLISQPEPTDSISLTQSDPCVLYIVVYVYVQNIYLSCFDRYMLCILFILLHVSFANMYFFLWLILCLKIFQFNHILF